MSVCTTRAFTAALVIGAACVTDAAPRVDSSRQLRRSGLSFWLASAQTTDDCRTMTVGGESLCVSHRFALDGKDVLEADVVEGGATSDVLLTLDPVAATRLTGMMDRFGATHLVVFRKDKLVAVGRLDTGGGRPALVGLAPEHARRLSQIVRDRWSGAPITLVPSATVIAPGGTVRVDVFASGLKDLRAYQVALDADGGTSGSLELKDISLDSKRPDFIYAGLEKLDAVDRVGGRIGAALFRGTIDVRERAYIGTFTYRASSNGSGSFRISLKTGDGTTMFTDGKHARIRVSSRSVLVRVGSTSSSKPMRE